MTPLQNKEGVHDSNPDRGRLAVTLRAAATKGEAAVRTQQLIRPRQPKRGDDLGGVAVVDLHVPVNELVRKGEAREREAHDAIVDRVVAPRDVGRTRVERDRVGLSELRRGRDRGQSGLDRMPAPRAELARIEQPVRLPDGGDAAPDDVHDGLLDHVDKSDGARLVEAGVPALLRYRHNGPAAPLGEDVPAGEAGVHDLENVGVVRLVEALEHVGRDAVEPRRLAAWARPPERHPIIERDRVEAASVEVLAGRGHPAERVKNRRVLSRDPIGLEVEARTARNDPPAQSPPGLAGVVERRPVLPGLVAAAHPVAEAGRQRTCDVQRGVRNRQSTVAIARHDGGVLGSGAAFPGGDKRYEAPA
mmetsp:Transcript_10433/g.42191  ORF Transcript_10433/g.42191 Transcript_10433/m.42191 type:complete len:361 (-) Transcript_10433:733-1815(-)